jgi:hypothetical protein
MASAFQLPYLFWNATGGTISQMDFHLALQDKDSRVKLDTISTN